VRCDLCPRLCKLKEGQRGLCFVRMAHDGEIVLTTYGRSSGYCVDPIEKKPLNHFYPGTGVLSFGTAGCNLACKFCQNWDISKSREWDTLADAAAPEVIARAAASLGCRSVAFTYNDPVIFMEYAVDVAPACHEHGVATVAVTAGEILPEPRGEFFGHMDAANVDLKAFTEDFYKRLCGGKLQPVLDTLKYLKHDTEVWFELTTLLIPGENDSDEEIDEMTRWVVDSLGTDVPMHFTAFHPDFKMRSTPPTPSSTLTRARRIAMNNGVQFAYTGNVHDEGGGSTYCHECGELLVGRDWYLLTAWNLDDLGRCISCGARCPGRFDGPPGDWGPRRLPVRLRDFESS
jgi:pyruvate formate lyase activating enzyme